LTLLPVLIALVAATIALMTDLRTRRIPNWLTVSGLVIGLVVISLVVVSWILFHFVAWKHARAMQHLYRALIGLFDWNVLSRLKPNERQRPPAKPVA